MDSIQSMDERMDERTDHRFFLNRLSCMTGEERGGCQCRKKSMGKSQEKPLLVKIQSSLNLKKGTGNVHS